MRIGKSSSDCPNIHLQMSFVSVMTQEDLAIFVSYCGETKGIVMRISNVFRGMWGTCKWRMNLLIPLSV